MVAIRPLIAKVLIQVGADEPKEIGTIEIPINVSIPNGKLIGHLVYPPSRHSI